MKQQLPVFRSPQSLASTILLSRSVNWTFMALSAIPYGELKASTRGRGSLGPSHPFHYEMINRKGIFWVLRYWGRHKRNLRDKSDHSRAVYWEKKGLFSSAGPNLEGVVCEGLQVFLSFLAFIIRICGELKIRKSSQEVSENWKAIQIQHRSDHHYYYHSCPIKSSLPWQPPWWPFSSVSAPAT